MFFPPEVGLAARVLLEFDCAAVHAHGAVEMRGHGRAQRHCVRKLHVIQHFRQHKVRHRLGCEVQVPRNIMAEPLDAPGRAAVRKLVFPDAQHKRPACRIQGFDGKRLP